MISAAQHPQEQRRLQALLDYQILDTPPEPDFDEIVALASEICETPISLVSLIDSNRQWFKAKVGLDAIETPRAVAFCAHAILQDDVFIVEDSFLDERFKDNPLATDAPHVRFYAGAPLVNKEGMPLGTLCAIDSVPRTLSELQIKALRTLSHQVVAQLELRLLIQKQQEQLLLLQKQAQDKNRFFSIVSHDLRSPFNGILGLANLLAEDCENLDADEVKEYAQDIQHSAQAAYDLVDNLLNWSMLEGGALKIELGAIQIGQLLEEVRCAVGAFAEQKKIELHFEVEDHMSVLADRNMLRSLLLNLISNAVKFSSSNDKIFVKTRHCENRIGFEVQDFGTGISPDQLLDLQKLGACSSSLGTQGEHGTGLGLKLCFEFAQKMNSKLMVDSKPEQGTCFRFALPIA